ncbi:MAG: phenylalanine--tRNA ligase subunit beta [Actinomycetota bacterium]|nr:phenylalanine--tRNA ligase subunit beta [Actinomycetota bacterium]
MRVPLSWLRPMVPGLTASGEEVAAALVRAGLEVEQVHRVGHDVTGVLVGQVLDVEELTGHKKPIRYCHVDVGGPVHEVVCGATNFRAGDRVAFAAPGAMLPGPFRIAARQTYGRTSDGMICSAQELGLSEDHGGIMVLGPDVPLGADIVEVLGLRDEVLDIAVTPDRGYTLSIRGVARETATAFELPFLDPAPAVTPASTLATSPGPMVRIDDAGCQRYVAALVTGLSSEARSPVWLQRRLTLAGMRPISLAVDVTNHVMLELGQPLHAFDLDRLQGAMVIRRAHPGETLHTLDGQERQLAPGDLVIADDSGAVALAGVMGGASTEVGPSTTALLIEAAHFDPASVARTARRHRLPSEASRRFERGVDPGLAASAASAAVRLLVELGGVTAGPSADVDARTPPPVIPFPIGLPGQVAGRPYPPETVRRRLEDVGASVSEASAGLLLVTPPSWRPDLIGPADLVEEVIRLEGYDSVPVALPTAPAGRGLTEGQRLRRTASRALAAAGFVEVVTPPFVGTSTLEVLGLSGHEAPRLQNPLSETEAHLRPSLLPGLLAALIRNAGRGLADCSLYETGAVFRGSGTPVAEVPKTAGRPTDAQLAELDAALPRQPRMAAVVLAGVRQGRPAGHGDATEALIAMSQCLGLELTLGRATVPPYHPGRCASLQLHGQVVGNAGELHPRVVAAMGLPARTCAGEVDLDLLVTAAAALGPVRAPVVSTFPAAAIDVALVVDADALAGDVEAAVREGAGPLLEACRLFDDYAGPQVGEGRRSLAFALRLRAPDRTLTDSEVVAVRDAAVAQAQARTGAVLRST